MIANFWEFIAILADVLQTFRLVFIALLTVNSAIKKQIYQVENTINNIWDIVGQVLKALTA